MDTNRIKRFATEARNILKTGIAAKIMTLGFDRKGNVAEEHRPQLMQGGTLWNGKLYTEGFYHQWMSLFNRVQEKGINEVYEEAAYTWFNRLCAIRILQKNNLCSPVLQYTNAARTPVIVDQARQGHLPLMKEDLRQRIIELLDDDTKVTEQFALLITAWCHDNPIINQCFGSMADYTELLLPNNILTESGFVDMLNHTEFITDEDFQSPELIGWLYQFYISERKDEVFAKKGKFEADEIPAATQIFTPNWIVKYMVQNTVGRIYLDNNPYETTLQKKWQYLVEPAEKPTPENILKYNELTELKVADLACGSGHILNECFDLLYDLYIAEGYSRGEAIENIFRHNLTGVDLDNRAKQLATFSLLLKACQKDSSFADAHCLPNILTMPKPWNEEADGNLDDFLSLYFQGENTSSQNEEFAACFELIQDADSLGSIMKFKISDSTRLLVKQATDYWCSQEIVPDAIQLQLSAFKLILALTEKYHALVMNPPYMGYRLMNSILLNYATHEYPNYKTDLSAIFMSVSKSHVIKNGKYSMINMQSWMFLTSFTELRHDILTSQHIDNLIHLGAHTFDELNGEVVQNVAFVTSNNTDSAPGIYYRLVNGENCSKKEKLFHYKNLAIIVNQYNFYSLPNYCFSYWASKKIINCFMLDSISTIADARKGNSTSDNNRFLKLWHEVNYRKLAIRYKSVKDANSVDKYWIPYNKGGGYRRWYGINEYVVYWKDNGLAIRNCPKSVVTNEKYYMKNGSTWGHINSQRFSSRFFDDGFIFDNAGNCLFSDETNTYLLNAYLNSCVFQYLSEFVNPTIGFSSGVVASMPYKFDTIKNINIIQLDKENIKITRDDWDAHETSWDFETNPLLAVDENIYIDNKQTGILKMKIKSK